MFLVSERNIWMSGLFRKIEVLQGLGLRGLKSYERHGTHAPTLRQQDRHDLLHIFDTVGHVILHVTSSCSVSDLFQVTFQNDPISIKRFYRYGLLGSRQLFILFLLLNKRKPFSFAHIMHKWSQCKQKAIGFSFRLQLSQFWTQSLIRHFS